MLLVLIDEPEVCKLLADVVTKSYDTHMEVE